MKIAIVGAGVMGLNAAFAAGANAFKKGDTWIDLPDTTILINGELWVPTTVLQHLE